MARRLATATAASAAALLVSAAGALAATGDLTQKAAPDGCIIPSNVAGCRTARALSGASAVAVSSDGKNAYIASDFGVAVLDRDTDSGGLTQKAGPDGCIGNIWGCTRSWVVPNASSVALSPDGKSAYLVSDGALIVFDRAAGTGSLTLKAGANGCITGDPRPGLRDRQGARPPAIGHRLRRRQERLRRVVVLRRGRCVRS